MSLLQGITLVKPLSQKLNLNISNYAVNKLFPETKIYDDMYYNDYPIFDKWSVGVKLGFEYVF